MIGEGLGLVKKCSPKLFLDFRMKDRPFVCPGDAGKYAEGNFVRTRKAFTGTTSSREEVRAS